MASFISHRRFFLSRRIAARETGELALSSLWHRKQLAEPGGTEFPVGFPERAALAAVGYVASEDLVGADEEELLEWVHLSSQQAKTVLAAAAAL